MLGMSDAVTQNTCIRCCNLRPRRLPARRRSHHHTGVVQMAQTEQADGQYADAVELAEQIEQSQTAEIATMEELLED